MAQADSVHSTPPTNTSPTRRVFLTTIAAVPIAAAGPAAAAQTLDAELIELGARLEPLVDQYYAARAIWAPLLTAAHAERDQKFGDLPYRSQEKTDAFDECCERSGVDEASDALHAAYEEMEPLMRAINASPVNSIEGLRAKALVAFYEVAPLSCGDTEYSFDGAFPFQQIFTAVADLCGLNGKLAATGYKMPDLSFDDSDEEEEA
jgi:hypothetical protein